MLFGNLGGRYTNASRDAGYAALQGIARLTDLLAALEMGEAAVAEMHSADASRLLRESFSRFDALATIVLPRPLTSESMMIGGSSRRYDRFVSYAQDDLGVDVGNVSDLPRVCARQLQRLADLVDNVLRTPSLADSTGAQTVLLEMARTITVGTGVAQVGSLLETEGAADA